MILVYFLFYILINIKSFDVFKSFFFIYTNKIFSFLMKLRIQEKQGDGRYISYEKVLHGDDADLYLYKLITEGIDAISNYDYVFNGNKWFAGNVYINGVLITTGVTTATVSSSDRDIIFNRSGNLTGDTRFNWDYNTGTFKVTNGDIDLVGDLNVTGRTNLFGDLGVNGNSDIKGNLTVTGNTYLYGNLFVSGTTTYLHVKDLYISDNMILINSGETGSGVTMMNAGIEIDRGSSSSYYFIFNENTDAFRVGLSADTQAVATREDSPINGGIAIWNNSLYRFDTTNIGSNTQIIFNSGGTLIGQSGLTWDYVNQRLGIGISIPNEQLEITNNFRLPTTTSNSVGNIMLDANRFLHVYGTDNLFFGVTSGNYTTSGAQNIGIGKDTLSNITNGSNNVAIGYLSMDGGNGSQNTAVGGQSLSAAINGSSNNTAVGYQAGYSTIQGGNNTYVGYQAGYSLTTGTYNFIGGHSAMYNSTDADHNVALGYYAGRYIQGDNNIAIGQNAMLGSVTTTSAATNNVAFGNDALRQIISGQDNVAFGNRSSYSISSGQGNISSGYYSLYYNSSGSHNIAFGLYSMVGIPYMNTSYSICFGWHSGMYSLGNHNIYIGAQAGSSVNLNTSTNTENIGIGHNSLASITTSTATFNTAVGVNSGYFLTTGNHNTFIGKDAGYTGNTFTDNVFLGYQAGYYETGSNKLFVDNQKRTDETTARSNALIYGVFSANTALQYLTFNANVGINTITPAYALDVSGTTRLGTNTGWTEFETDGTLVMKNEAIVYNDIIIPSAGLGAAASAPDQEPLGDGTLIRAYAFNGAATMEQLYGQFEIPHDYRTGSTLEVHVHWSPTTTNTGNVLWNFEYISAQMGGGYLTGLTILSYSGSTDGNQWMHKYTSLGEINDSNMYIGAIIAFRLYRDPTIDIDTYPDDASLLSIGVHYEADTLGSRQRAIK
jgi:hypothetical protein